jgi:hypothetical protein
MATRPVSLDSKRLSIYLNDHLAASSVGVELAKRTRASNPSGELGAFLATLVVEIESDRDALADLMTQLGVRQDRSKLALGWAGEKVGRLKLNGQLRGYSPLSRLVELEGLYLGVEGKRSLWRVLAHRIGEDPRLRGIDLGELIERATRQLDQLDRHRLEAADAALLAS